MPCATTRLLMSAGKDKTPLVQCLLLLLAFSLTSCDLASQSVPDNQLTTLSPIGVPPNASTTGTSEQIVLANGSLHVNFPMLSVPQRGGWTLPLMYSYDSNILHPIQNVQPTSTYNNSDGCTNACGVENQREFYESYVKYRQVLEPNVPRLQAANEFIGFVAGQGGSANYVAHCITNWVFTDWSGASHSFGALLSCDLGNGSPPVVLTSDAADGSFYRLDLHNVSDIVVYGKDGTQFHFTGLKDPNAAGPSGGANGQGNQENFFDTRTMHMTDVNGNTVSVTSSSPQDGSEPVYTLVDTIGRSFTMGPTGLTYYDSNGNQQSFTISAPVNGPTLSTAVSYNNMNCVFRGTTYPYEKTPQVFNPPAMSSTATSLITITEPISDQNGHARAYTLQLDAPQHLLKVTYPSGGYTRYDFRDYQSDTWNGGVECPYTDWFQVVAKHVCRDSAGGCSPSTEDTTTYTASNMVSAQANQNSPYNGTVTVKDALSNAGDPHGSVETHTFATQGPQHTSALETNVTIANTSGTVLKTVHTDYTPAINYTELTFPQTITTTLNDSPGGVKSVLKTIYGEAYTLVSPPPVGSGGTISAFLDNPTEVDTTDFAGKTLTTITRSWKPESAFSPPHVLDRLDTEHLQDKVAGTDQQTVMGYDTNGNVTSSTKSGAGVVTSALGFGTYTNGYPASMTDARNNVTKLAYTENFPAGTCLGAAVTGAYLSSMTLPNGAQTTYTHYPCTGTLATVTDPNGNVTTYTYDPLARELSASMPGGFSRSTVYNDGQPNSSQVTTFATPSPNVISLTTLDGLGRSSSVVTGGIEKDTTYDGDGRTASVSNPMPQGSVSSFTTKTYDALSRITQVSYPDQSASTTSYFGEVSVATDPSGNQHVNTMNSQGLISSVCEVAAAIPQTGEQPSACAPTPGPTLSGYTTSYVYDGRGNLSAVNARGQSRTFAYDTFGRLTKATNPETGTLCYGTPDTNGNCIGGYDMNGNLVTKTDARSRVTNYSYDALNRMTAKWTAGATSAAAGLGTCFVYDHAGGSGSSVPNAVGHLVTEWTQVGACTSGAAAPGAGNLSAHFVTSIDPMGRVLTEQRCTLNSCSSLHPQSYQYNLAGSLTSYMDGLGGTTFTQSYDSAGRFTGLTSSVSDPQQPANLLQVKAYSPSSPYAWSSAVFGGSFTATRNYDLLQRVTSHVVTTGVSQ